MVPFLDETNSGIGVRIWVGIWLEVIVGADKQINGWMFQTYKGKIMGIKELDEEFQES